MLTFLLIMIYLVIAFVSVILIYVCHKKFTSLSPFKYDDIKAGSVFFGIFWPLAIAITIVYIAIEMVFMLLKALNKGFNFLFDAIDEKMDNHQ